MQIFHIFVVHAFSQTKLDPKLCKSCTWFSKRKKKCGVFKNISLFVLGTTHFKCRKSTAQEGPADWTQMQTSIRPRSPLELTNINPQAFQQDLPQPKLWRHYTAKITQQIFSWRLLFCKPKGHLRRLDEEKKDWNEGPHIFWDLVFFKKRRKNVACGVKWPYAHLLDQNIIYIKLDVDCRL